MLLDEAREQAEALVREIAPFCERVEIAGSVRRGRPEVKDIEIVAVPRWDEHPGADLFGDPVEYNRLHEWAVGQSGIRWIKTGTPEVIDWQPKAAGKYWRGLLVGNTKLDLFLARPENFGAIFLIRTGSAEFSQAVVTHAKRIGKPCVEGFFHNGGEPVATPEEEDVFRLLSLAWVAPELRTDGSALRRLAR